MSNMGEDKDVFDIIRDLGITDAQLRKYYEDIDGTIDWDRVEKAKSRLHILFPDPRTLIERLDEALEEIKNKVDEEVDTAEKFRREVTPALWRLHQRLQHVSNRCTVTSIVSIVLSLVAVIIAVIF